MWQLFQNSSVQLDKDTADDSLRVYRFVLFTTWLTLFAFSFSFFLIDAWFSLSVVLFGALVINPLCILLAKHGNPTFGRVVFIGSCNIYVLLASMGCNNLIQAQFFLIAISISSIILFNSNERKFSFFSILWIFSFWFMTQVDAKLILPDSFVVSEFPVAPFQNLSFIGSLLLSVSYLFFHVQALERHYSRVQKATLSLNQEKTEALGLLTKIANNVPGVVYQYRVSTEGKASFPYSSLGMKKIYRVTPEQVQNDASVVMDIIHPEDLEAVKESIEKSARFLTPWQSDYRVKFDEDVIEWRRGVAKPQLESDGAILWHGFIMDITNEKELESDLLQAQKAAIHSSRLASLGEMAGGIAHEINTPLMIISNKSSLIQKIISTENPSLERVSQEIEKIRQTTFRIANIVKGLLTFARGDKDVDFKIVSVESLFNDVKSLSTEKAKSEGVEIQYDYDPTLTLLGKSVQLSQVLLNLINNAIDAVSALPQRWVKVEVQKLKNEVIRFSVTDSGSGLNPEQLEKLMQPFFTTKAVGKGTGLGLSISKGLVEGHGGKLTYDESCQNTRFYFDLKFVSAESLPQKNSA